MNRQSNYNENIFINPETTNKPKVTNKDAVATGVKTKNKTQGIRNKTNQSQPKAIWNSS